MNQQTDRNEELRFSFGQNWARYLRNIDDSRIHAAELSLKEMLGVESLNGKGFIDVGCGSGLFSLAARRLGASVHSFDVDPDSVTCANALREKYHPRDPHWVVEQGSALNQQYLNSLGEFDYVYSWGVLHHTGAMWTALENVTHLVKPGGGLLFIALYNDQGGTSVTWRKVKRLYNRFPWVRPLLLLGAGLRLYSGTWLRAVPSVLFRKKAGPVSETNRGMAAWTDLIDWVGGYPFEVATPDMVIEVLHGKGFQLKKLKTRQGIGTNEFVFVRLAPPIPIG